MSFIADKKREHESKAEKALIDKDYAKAFFHTAVLRTYFTIHYPVSPFPKYRSNNGAKFFTALSPNRKTSTITFIATKSGVVFSGISMPFMK